MGEEHGFFLVAAADRPDVAAYLLATWSPSFDVFVGKLVFAEVFHLGYATGITVESNILYKETPGLLLSKCLKIGLLVTHFYRDLVSFTNQKCHASFLYAGII